jgi:uncharacterized protein YaiI (UPF0178 family)
LKEVKTAINIYVDADSCPVKQEVYRVATRYRLNVILVSNARMKLPDNVSARLVIVDGGLDAADDWIAEHATGRDIVVTADIPLASRCLKKEAKVIGPKGASFTEESIGDALATRELMNHLRDLGEIGGGPAPFEKRDRSRFLHKLDEVVQAMLREQSKSKTN